LNIGYSNGRVTYLRLGLTEVLECDKHLSEVQRSSGCEQSGGIRVSCWESIPEVGARSEAERHSLKINEPHPPEEHIRCTRESLDALVGAKLISTSTGERSKR
jgi:hypothetical protein